MKGTNSVRINQSERPLQRELKGIYRISKKERGEENNALEEKRKGKVGKGGMNREKKVEREERRKKDAEKENLPSFTDSSCKFILQQSCELELTINSPFRCSSITEDGEVFFLDFHSKISVLTEEQKSLK